MADHQSPNPEANPLAELRDRLDEVDGRLLDLLAERGTLVSEVLETKKREGLPIFVPAREQQKVETFRLAAQQRGLDPDWSEDFLRMIMGSSRASQSLGEQPSATAEPKTVLLVGGGGRMGALYGQFFAASGHQVRILEKDDWDQGAELAKGCDLAIVTVPIRETEAVINRLAPLLEPGTLLGDFTSHKVEPVMSMIQMHNGPVMGMHPMHGPDVQNLSKQLMVVCPSTHPAASDWLLDQFRLWGLRVVEVAPPEHDETMHLVQGLRHFLALLHGSFLAQMDRAPAEMLQLSSPIYRAELMMTGRIFAQNPELYADIVLSDERRREILLEFLDHHQQLSELVFHNDKAAFSERFREIQDFFGDFADQALSESSYLIHRLADRFA
jgi:chorismate mutase/prephenate dehydrogenase